MLLWAGVSFAPLGLVDYINNNGVLVAEPIRK